MEDDILEIAEQVYWVKYEIVPSILPHQCQEQVMKELHDELGQGLTSVDLQEATWTGSSLSRRRRCSHACSSSQAWLPFPGQSLTRASLQEAMGTARSLYMDRWCSHAYFFSQLSHPPWAYAGMKTPQPHGPIGTAICGTSDPQLPSVPPLHHTHSMEMSGYTTHSAACTYSSSSKGPKRGK